MIKKIWTLYINLSNRMRTSISWSVALVGLISTVMSVVGISLNAWTNKTWLSIILIIVVFVVIAMVIFVVIGLIYKESVSVTINNNLVSIKCGDIFSVKGWKVIGCDTHFDTRVDDVVISKKSLQGKLILEYGNIEEIKRAVKKKAKRLGLKKNKDGLYDFELGTIIRYDSSVDNETYLMLAMTELDQNYEAHTNIAKFENMLVKMWSEISRVYAGNDVVLPLLGNGILRFDGVPKNKETLLKCILCTLNNSGVSLTSAVNVVIYSNAKDIPLYEYKDMFRQINKRG